MTASASPIPRSILGLLALIALGSAMFAQSSTQGQTKKPPLTFAEQLAKAEKGNANAQYMVGYSYQKGYGIAKNEVEAVKWYRKAADFGVAAAQSELGRCYENGQGVAKDAVEAVKLYSKAAEQGFAVAQSMLASCLDRGLGIPQSAFQAVTWYRRSAEQGFLLAQDELGLHYAKGLGVPKASEEAYFWWSLAAMQGDKTAMGNLSMLKGGLSRDQLARATQRLRNAKPKQTGDGFLVPTVIGESPRQDFRETLANAEKGDAKAQILLGFNYNNGEGIAKDVNEAVKWFRKAAEQGSAEGKIKLALCYRQGLGVPKDASEAVKWIRKAAEMSDAEAQAGLGLCYYKGEGVEKDATEAVKWYRKSAEQGSAMGQHNLGVCYVQGAGVPKDYSEAFLLISLSALDEGEGAKKDLATLKGMMSHEQLAEGERRLQESKLKRPGGALPTLGPR